MLSRRRVEARRDRRGDDSGSILPMVAGFTAIAAILVVVGIDVSAVYLAQRALSSAADSAALAGAEGIDKQAVYSGAPLGCGAALPLSEDRAVDLVRISLDGDATDLRHTFASIDQPVTTIGPSAQGGSTVSVQLTGTVVVPFGHVLGWLDPGHPGGRVTLDATSHAQSPIAGDTC